MKTLSKFGEETSSRLQKYDKRDLLITELLEFWGRHPNNKYTINIICYALDRNRRDVETALHEMINMGLVEMSRNYCECLYSLTEDQVKGISVINQEL
jgi:predicted transcriptional regulator